MHAVASRASHSIRPSMTTKPVRVSWALRPAVSARGYDAGYIMTAVCNCCCLKVCRPLASCLTSERRWESGVSLMPLADRPGAACRCNDSAGWLVATPTAAKGQPPGTHPLSFTRNPYRKAGRGRQNATDA